MGTLRSKTNHGGMTVNGVLLGDVPPILRQDLTPAGVGDSLNDMWFIWDDHRIPSGEIDADGNIIPDSVDDSTPPAPAPEE